MLADNVQAFHRFVEARMAKYKHIDTQPRLIAVDLSRELLPGTFEHALNHLLDSKHRSGTRADFERQAAKLESAARTMVARHRATDTAPTEPPPSTKAQQRIAQLERDAQQMRAWLAANPDDRRGAKGSIRKSNRTDNESAKMATGKGVIQGCTGVATVDAAHQIIVDAQAHGTGSEQEILLHVVASIVPMMTRETLLTADAGYHREANLRQLAAMHIPALIADNDMRRRDERLGTRTRYAIAPHPLHDKSRTKV